MKHVVLFYITRFKFLKQNILINLWIINSNLVYSSLLKPVEIKIMFCIFSTPQNTLIQLIQDLNRLSVQLIKNRLIQRIHLQRSQLEILIRQQLLFNDRFSLVLAHPHINHVVGVAFSVPHPIVWLFEHFIRENNQTETLSI